MPGQIDALYQVKPADTAKAGTVLVDAFQHDPIWKLFFKSETSIHQRGVMFESPIRYGLRYGSVVAPSEQLEGIAIWFPGDLANMTPWRLIRSGAIFAGLKAIKVCTKLVRKQVRIFKPLQADRKANPCSPPPIRSA